MAEAPAAGTALTNSKNSHQRDLRYNLQDLRKLSPHPSLSTSGITPVAIDHLVTASSPGEWTRCSMALYNEFGEAGRLWLRFAANPSFPTRPKA